MNSKHKQDQIIRELDSKNLEFIGLVETRLQSIDVLNNKNIAQTYFARKGGVLAVNGGRIFMKTVKILKQFLTLQHLQYGKVPPPYIYSIYSTLLDEKVKELQNRLIYMIESLKSKYKNQSIIVIGCFKLPYQRSMQETSLRGNPRIHSSRSGNSQKRNQLDLIFSCGETIFQLGDRPVEINRPQTNFSKTKNKIPGQGTQTIRQREKLQSLRYKEIMLENINRRLDKAFLRRTSTIQYKNALKKSQKSIVRQNIGIINCQIGQQRAMVKIQTTNLMKRSLIRTKLLEIWNNVKKEMMSKFSCTWLKDQLKLRNNQNQ
ncbi:hypothetical protein OXYTRIMIC_297 [Oxytricha trifallax]|uniref:Uncharacterized protein n=1 Tax=Oxytricha trifallax TaxID=1172189 RepID=A0A073HZ45_9SPIT|nr:hypothetical protein OXYTRIMIC_297 [Oxytricha trifallax]